MSPLLDYTSFCQIVEEQLEVTMQQPVTEANGFGTTCSWIRCGCCNCSFIWKLEHGYVLADEQLAQLPQMTVDQLLQSLARKEVV